MRRLRTWLGTLTCITLLLVVATMDRRFHGAPQVRADVSTAIGQPGEKLLDFTLPDVDGNPVTLSSFFGKSRVVLTFERSLDW